MRARKSGVYFTEEVKLNNFKFIRLVKPLLIFILFAADGVFGQNLIPDSSFESNKAVPIDFSGIGYSNSWTRPGMGTTDLFSVNDRKRKKYSMVGVPQNAMGFQKAHSGSSYAGFFLFSHGNYREYLQTPLRLQLEKDKTYFISFYISLANFSQTYIDQLGFCFLPDEKHYNTADVLEDMNPVYIKLEKVGDDTMKWHQLTGVYKAKGSEKYLLIGSFEVYRVRRTKFRFPKDMKSPINKNSARDAYYFVDDVSLVEWINPPLDEIRKDSIFKTMRDTVSSDEIYILKNVTFKSASSELDKNSFSDLDRLATFLMKNNAIRIEIAGHTDNIGGIKENEKLSKRRAIEVSNYLLKKGVARKRMNTAGYGDSKPIVSNDTEESRALNRRVEIIFLK